MDHAAIIETLGGTPGIAGLLELPNDWAPAQWKRRGIPVAYWPRVIGLLREKGVEVTFEQLLASKPIPARVAGARVAA